MSTTGSTPPERELTPAEMHLAEILARIARRIAEDEAAKNTAPAPATGEAPIAPEG